VIELLQFAPGMGLMNASPFCMKVEIFLRLAGLEYRTRAVAPLRTPKGKLPVLRDAGRTIADSEAIVAYLQAQYAARLPPALAVPETGPQLLLRRTIEEHLYFAALRWRWLDEGAAPHTRVFFDALPAPLRAPVFALVRRKMRRDLVGQGLGRHGGDEICAKARADLDAVAGFLGDRPFFAGDAPGAIDCCAYAFYANLAWVPVESPMKRHALEIQSLGAFADRMKSLAGREAGVWPPA